MKRLWHEFTTYEDGSPLFGHPAIAPFVCVVTVLHLVCRFLYP